MQLTRLRGDRQRRTRLPPAIEVASIRIASGKPPHIGQRRIAIMTTNQWMVPAADMTTWISSITDGVADLWRCVRTIRSSSTNTCRRKRVIRTGRSDQTLGCRTRLRGKHELSSSSSEIRINSVIASHFANSVRTGITGCVPDRAAPRLVRPLRPLRRLRHRRHRRHHLPTPFQPLCTARHIGPIAMCCGPP